MFARKQSGKTTILLFLIAKREFYISMVIIDGKTIYQTVIGEYLMYLGDKFLLPLEMYA